MFITDNNFIESIYILEVLLNKIKILILDSYINLNFMTGLSQDSQVDTGLLRKVLNTTDYIAI